MKRQPHRTHQMTNSRLLRYGLGLSSSIGFHDDLHTGGIVVGKGSIEDQPHRCFGGIDNETGIEFQIRIVGFERVGQFSADLQSAIDGILIGIDNITSIARDEADLHSIDIRFEIPVNRCRKR